MKQKKRFEIEKLEGLKALQLKDGRELRWVPSFEGILAYDPQELADDKILNFWSIRYNRLFGSIVRYKMHSSFSRSTKGIGFRQFIRRAITIRIRGIKKTFRCSYLTMLCMKGIKFHHNLIEVVDHINGIPLDDRPSNLQCISQVENLKKSTLSSYQKLPIRLRKVRALAKERFFTLTKKYLERIPELADDKLGIEIEVWLRMKEEGERINEEWEKYY